MNLLNRTLRVFLFYSFVTLLVTVPIFYVVVRQVLLHSVDRSLRAQVRDIRSNLSAIKSADDLHVWSELDKDIQLRKLDLPLPDRLYTDYNLQKYHSNDHDPIRKLDASIEVKGAFYLLTVSTSLVENEDLLGSIVAVEVVLMFALLGGLLWINQRIARRIWAPFYGTLAKVQDYELSKSPDLQLDHTDILEFQYLNAALENLVRKNYQVYQAQREFTENASHEMQTPLAIFQNGLETLMQTPFLTEPQAAIIHMLETNIQRLNRINRSLLLLAKLDNGEFPPPELLDIREILEKAILSHQYFLEEKNIMLSVTGDAPAIIRANRSLTEILIGNMISNATRHNVNGGKIDILLNERQLQIGNTGVWQSLESDQLFQRFHKTAVSTEGNGLGLAIVKKISEVNKFLLQYRFCAGVHIFELLFNPLNP